jgi:hypothetical protein
VAGALEHQRRSRTEETGSKVKEEKIPLIQEVQDTLSRMDKQKYPQPAGKKDTETLESSQKIET